MSEPIDPNPKNRTSSKELFLEYIGEIIGYEKGFYRTFIELRKQPKAVVESYLSKEGIYVSPFKMLITFVSVWLLFNNLAVDWYATWDMYLSSLSKFLWFNIHHETKPIPATTLNENKYISKIAGDLFSKYYMAIILLSAPLWAYFCTIFCRQYKIDFRTHFAVVGYHLSLSFLPSLILVGLLAINFWLFLIAGLIVMISPMIGLKSIYNRLATLVPVRDFFLENGVSIEKRYFRARLLSTIILLAVYFIMFGTFAVSN